MSASEMAHMLKQLGGGSEEEGIRYIFRTGGVTGAGLTLLAGVALYGGYKLYRWGRMKVEAYLQEHEYIAAVEEKPQINQVQEEC